MAARCPSTFRSRPCALALILALVALSSVPSSATTGDDPYGRAGTFRVLAAPSRPLRRAGSSPERTREWTQAATAAGLRVGEALAADDGHTALGARVHQYVARGFYVPLRADTTRLEFGDTLVVFQLLASAQPREDSVLAITTLDTLPTRVLIAVTHAPENEISSWQAISPSELDRYPEPEWVHDRHDQVLIRCSIVLVLPAIAGLRRAPGGARVPDLVDLMSTILAASLEPLDRHLGARDQAGPIRDVRLPHDSGFARRVLGLRSAF